jgi:hypothetical protein
MSSSVSATIALLEGTDRDAGRRTAFRRPADHNRRLLDLEAERPIQRQRLHVEGVLERRMPRAPAPRSMTAFIKRRPTPCPCALGSTVIGPTPVIGPRSSRKLEPTICPSASATTPQIAGCAMKLLVSCAAASSVGKSRGNRWWSWRRPKASYRIRAHSSPSAGSIARDRRLREHVPPLRRPRTRGPDRRARRAARRRAGLTAGQRAPRRAELRQAAAIAGVRCVERVFTSGAARRPPGARAGVRASHWCRPPP